MVRTQNIINYRRYSNPSITVHQTVKAGRRLTVRRKTKRRVSRIRAFLSKIFNIIKLGLFLGAAVCPVTCVFVIGWLLLD